MVGRQPIERVEGFQERNDQRAGSGRGERHVQVVLDGTDGYPVVRDRDLVAAATVDDRLWGDQRMLPAGDA